MLPYLGPQPWATTPHPRGPCSEHPPPRAVGKQCPSSTSHPTHQCTGPFRLGRQSQDAILLLPFEDWPVSSSGAQPPTASCRAGATHLTSLVDSAPLPCGVQTSRPGAPRSFPLLGTLVDTPIWTGGPPTAQGIRHASRKMVWFQACLGKISTKPFLHFWIFSSPRAQAGVRSDCLSLSIIVFLVRAF